MGIPHEVNLEKDGGHYHKAMAFRYALTWPILPFVAVVLIVAIINPFWFRDSFFHWVERKVNSFSQWRNYKMYGIYLGCDPKVWHALKDIGPGHDGPDGQVTTGP